MIVPPDAETALQIVKEALEGSVYDMIVFDSIAKLSPKSEIEAEFDKATQVGLQARMVTRFTRAMGHALYLSNTAVLAINQVRDDIGAYMPTKKSTGGNAWEHEAALRIYMLSSQEQWAGGAKHDRIVRLIFRWKMRKYKMGDYDEVTNEVTLEHLPDGTYQIDEVKEVFTLAKGMGLFKTAKDEVWEGRGGAFFYVEHPSSTSNDFRPVSLGVGEDKILEAIGQDYDLFKAIKTTVISARTPATTLSPALIASGESESIIEQDLLFNEYAPGD